MSRANNLRPGYQALKKLRSKSTFLASAIHAADGRLVSDMDGQMARWAEYFGQLFTVDPPIEQLHTTGLRAADADPPIDEASPSLDEVFRKIVSLFGVDFTLFLNKRGFYPKGQGEILMEVKPLKNALKGVDITDFGELVSVHGIAYVAGALPIKVAHKMANAATELLQQRLDQNIEIQINRVKDDHERAFGNGSGIVDHGSAVELNITCKDCVLSELVRCGGVGKAQLVAVVDDVLVFLFNMRRKFTEGGDCVRNTVGQSEGEKLDDVFVKYDTAIPSSTPVDKLFSQSLWAKTSTGCVLGGSSLGKRGREAEEDGCTAASDIIKCVESRVCLDDYAQDQVIIYMALAKGRSRIRTGPLTNHTRTAIWLAKMMTKTRGISRVCRSTRNNTLGDALRITSMGQYRSDTSPQPWIRKKSRVLDVTLTRLRLGHKTLTPHLHRLRLSPDPQCPWCRNVLETIEHFLLQCPRFHSHRVVLHSQHLALKVTTFDLPTLLAATCVPPSRQHAVIRLTCAFLRKTGQLPRL
ncbi:RNA 3'-terminal phosphate cyclase [Chionoecetes opilio]|uniref:RNA 3'-terminal phosphate cyclase n=1 Tax=Chionoecetes opilio TaxID=41210 RepID=A0A8J4XZN0_CHIOP|nr:RNA 3'-terminal phosphate cyclase [Chionoecetes opilio]